MDILILLSPSEYPVISGNPEHRQELRRAKRVRIQSTRDSIEAIQHLRGSAHRTIFVENRARVFFDLDFVAALERQVNLGAKIVCLDS